MPPLDPDHFRQLCGRFATGVTIVTTRDDREQPVGMTVSAFASASLDPPLIAIAVDRGASMHPVLLQAERFAINILTADQEPLSRRFASELPDRFEGIGWHPDPDGQVLLDGVLATLCCEMAGHVPAGDHTLFLGRVVGGEVVSAARPLLHYRGGYAEAELSR
jgi:flavin reductase (DIM6/NTAB) family NADH-FMN oxidoreductase RutF